MDQQSAGAAVAALALVLLGAGLVGRSTPALALAILALGGLYAFAEDGHAVPAALFGTGLLLTAELAFWSAAEHVRLRAEPGVAGTRLVAVLTVAAAGLAASGVVSLASGADVSRTTLLTVLGAAAAAGSAYLLAALARPRTN